MADESSKKTEPVAESTHTTHSPNGDGIRRDPSGPIIANRPEDALLAEWRQAVMCLSTRPAN